MSTTTAASTAATSTAATSTAETSTAATSTAATTATKELTYVFRRMTAAGMITEAAERRVATTTNFTLLTAAKSCIHSTGMH